MAFCTKCGKQLSDEDAFCTGCGAPRDDAGQPPVSHPDPFAAPAAPAGAVYDPAPVVPADGGTPRKKVPVIPIAIGVVLVVVIACVAVLFATGVISLPGSNDSGKSTPSIVASSSSSSSSSSSVGSTSSSASAVSAVLTVQNPRTGQTVTETIRLNEDKGVIKDILTHRYTRAEIEALNLSDAELYIARNEIVARSGYRFQYEPNTQFFLTNCSWYNPVNTSYKLEGIPSENAATILEIEHARNSWYPEIK